MSQDIIDDRSLMQNLAKAQLKGHFSHVQSWCWKWKSPPKIVLFVFSTEAGQAQGHKHGSRTGVGILEFFPPRHSLAFSVAFQEFCDVDFCPSLFSGWCYKKKKNQSLNFYFPVWPCHQHGDVKHHKTLFYNDLKYVHSLIKPWDLGLKSGVACLYLTRPCMSCNIEKVW